MDDDLHYLQMRANFHSHMAQRATCGEARRAHQAFMRAYLERIERRKSLSRPDRFPAGPAAVNIAKPELVG